MNNNTNNKTNTNNTNKIYGIDKSRINKVSEVMGNNSSLIVIAVIILIILFIMLFNYTFNRRNISKTNEIKYNDEHNLKFTELKSCSEIDDELENYKLCDYYILSSYNTHLIGNQKYDYVSIDMIKKVLFSGARYIDLEICADSLDKNANPVIASGRLKGEWINSINTLNPQEVFSIIDSFAFDLDDGNKKISYPLFINLKLRTTNERVLNKLLDIIKLQLNNQRILNPSRYYKYPISIEKICKLKNKIIFFCDGEWSSTKLTEIIIPTFQCMTTIHHNDINNIATGNYNKSSTENKILKTLKEDKKDSNKFIQNYPTINSLIKKKEEVYDDIIESGKYSQPLEEYNKLCLSVVIPHTLDDVFTLNYDDSNAIQNGCNFITMNFQSNDDFINQHIELFKDSSFILKDKTLRYPIKREPTVNIDELYPMDNKETVYIDTNTLIKYNNQPIRIKTYSPDKIGKYLTCVGRNIKLHSKQIPNKRNLIINKDINKQNGKQQRINFTDINQGFMLIPSHYYSKTIKNGVLIRKVDVEDNENQSLFIKKKGSTLYLEYLSSISQLRNEEREKALMDYIFIITKSKCNEEGTLSFINSNSLNNDIIQYIGSYNDRIKFYNDTNNIDMRENTCFSIELLPINKYITIKHFISGKLLTEFKNTLLFKSNKLIDNSLFKLEKWEKSNTNVILKAPSGNYISIDFNSDNILKSNVKVDNKHISTKFIIKKTSYGYSITDNSDNYTLFFNNDNIPTMYNNNKIEYLISKNEINTKDNVFNIKNYYNLV